MKLNIDKPDSRDIPYSVLFGGYSASKKFPYKEIIRQKQLTAERTKMACTRFGLAHISNAQNLLELGSNYIQVSAKDLWLEAISKNPSIEVNGDYLQNGLKQFLDKGLISGYTLISTIDEAKSAIDNGNYIYTGSINGDWTKVKSERLYGIKEKSYGHIFAIVDYNNDGFIGFNSDGVGEFLIPFSLFGTTYSKYAIHDKKDNILFSSLNDYKNTAKSLGYKQYYEVYIKNKDNRLALLAFQLVFVGKINTKELLNIQLK